MTSELFKCKVEYNCHGFNLDISFETAKGITAIIGPSGSGKTTLCNLISGIISPTRGEILHEKTVFFNDKNKVNLKPEERQVGYVFQDPLLFPHINVRGNLLFGMNKGNRAEKLHSIITLFSIEELMERKPESLSGGEQKKISIARALLSDPKLLILDEPFSGIDPSKRENLFPYLEKLKSKLGIPILYISHQMDEVIRLADYVLLLEEGKSIGFGPLEKVFSNQNFSNFMGMSDTGTVLSAVVSDKNHLIVEGGKFISGKETLEVGKKIRVRVFARDVSIALSEPKDVSILNILSCSIEQISEVGQNEINVKLKLTQTPSGNPDYIISRITETSLTSLNLKKGQEVFALIKAVAITG